LYLLGNFGRTGSLTMKSVADIKQTLRRQWEQADYREQRLLQGSANWPLVIQLGVPTPRDLQHNLDQVKQHLQQWRQVEIGEVVWKSLARRSTDQPVAYPVQWKLHRPSEWIEAIADSAIRKEFQSMSQLVAQIDSLFHAPFVRRRSLWRNRPIDEVVQAAQLAMQLSPGCAAGVPLRCLTLAGIDTKFFERHESLLTTLLDFRFDGEVSRLGLEDFLGAYRESDHWLLIVDLDGSLLPYQKLKIRSSELAVKPLPGQRLLVIENETCQHLLPTLPQTVAVLGAGFDLSWMGGEWVKSKQLAYWGDIDSWGLQFLATARSFVGRLTPLLMSSQIFQQFAAAAVVEPLTASAEPPAALLEAERLLYQQLIEAPRGRLEQEFLPAEFVQRQIIDWSQSHSESMSIN